jgi:hypothetical protein
VKVIKNDCRPFPRSAPYVSSLTAWSEPTEKTAPVARPKLQNTYIAFEQRYLIILSCQQKVEATDLIEQ